MAEHVSIPDRFLDLLGSGDIDRWLELFAPDVVIDTPFAPTGDQRRFEGVEAVDRRFGDARKRMRSLRFVDRDLLTTTASGTFVVTCRSEGEMGNGAAYANRYCWIIRVDAEGLIVGVTEYFDPQPVLALRTAAD